MLTLSNFETEFVADNPPIDEKPMFHENLDLQNICTPVKHQVLRELLTQMNFDTAETNFLVDGFKNGFDIQYKGPVNRQSRAKNLKLTIGSKTILWNKLMKEVMLGRVAGPFKEVPFENFILSPIGLVPKAGSKDQTRLIFHLSYNFPGENEGEGAESLNFHTLRNCAQSNIVI